MDGERSEQTRPPWELSWIVLWICCYIGNLDGLIEHLHAAFRSKPMEIPRIWICWFSPEIYLWSKTWVCISIKGNPDISFLIFSRNQGSRVCWSKRHLQINKQQSSLFLTCSKIFIIFPACYRFRSSRLASALKFIMPLTKAERNTFHLDQQHSSDYFPNFYNSWIF